MRVPFLQGVLAAAVASFLSAPLFAADMKFAKIKLGDKFVLTKNTGDLEKLRTAFDNEKFKDCVQQATKAENKFPAIRAWIRLQSLRCANAEFTKNPGSAINLTELIADLHKNSDILLFGAASRPLRIELLNSAFFILQRDKRANRLAGSKGLEILSETRDWLDANQKIRFETLVRGEALSEALPRESGRQGVASSEEETDLYTNMKFAVKNGEWLSTAQKGVKLIQEFPGGTKAAEAAKDVLKSYLSWSDRTDDSAKDVRAKIIAEMSKADGQRIYDWAQALAVREKYADALILAKVSFEKLGGQPLSTQALMLAALSAHQTADFQTARELYGKLLVEHTGTKTAAEALFRLGLLDYRDGKYADAAEKFERFLATSATPEFELSSLYWLWRSKQKSEPDKAIGAAERLIKLYPISYYSLRARAELLGGKLTLEKSLKLTPEWSFKMTPFQEGAWERFLLLKTAGWKAEAIAELTAFDEPQTAQEKIVYSYVLAEAGDYYRSSEVLARSFILDPSLVALDTLLIGYPEIYKKEITVEAARYKIPPQLVQALIKQESSFRLDVKSPAGAMGLMQLMPLTAREVASDMRIKLPDLSRDLANPSVNIRIGTQYLNRRLRAFEGSVPLALAAYNAGIGNVRSWKNSRPDLTEIEKTPSSDPLQELWFDELPWIETTGYIKSILRNYLVYKMLDLGAIELADPVWKF